MTLYLSGPSTMLGVREPVADLPDPAVQAEVEELRKGGIEYYRRAEETVAGLAEAAARAALAAAQAGLPVRAAVHASDTATAETPTRTLRTLLRQAGLETADAMVVGGRGCDNLWLAVAVAADRLRALDDTGTAAALVVTADAVLSGTRLNQEARTVMSDGAGACLVSLRHPGGPALRIRAMLAATVPVPSGTTPMARARHHMVALRGLSDRAFAGLDRDRCRFLITGNVGHGVAQMFRSALGCAGASLYRPATDVGHCFAADGIHTLGLLLADPAAAGGDLVAVVATSPYTCSVMLVEVVRGAHA
jgi:3-oxoacyl-[acyl-carrier-protein] synthase-3